MKTKEIGELLQERIYKLEIDRTNNYDTKHNFHLSGHEITGYGKLLNGEIRFLYKLIEELGYKVKK